MPCSVTSKCTIASAMWQVSRRRAADKPPRHCCLASEGCFSGSAPWGAVGPGVRLRQHCPPPAAAAVSSKDPGADDGDGSVQDGLVNMIGIQIGQAHVSTYFEDASDKLRATAEQVRIHNSSQPCTNVQLFHVCTVSCLPVDTACRLMRMSRHGGIEQR